MVLKKHSFLCNTLVFSWTSLGFFQLKRIKKKIILCNFYNSITEEKVFVLRFKINFLSLQMFLIISIHHTEE